MGKCLIIGAMYQGELKEWLSKEQNDLMICADRGYERAVLFGLQPDIVIGDFDSMQKPERLDSGIQLIQYPVHKDDTDTLLCIKKAIEKGYKQIRIAGCIGGRVDHSLANLQCLYYCAKNGINATLADNSNSINVLVPGEYTFSRGNYKYLSLLAYSDVVKGITLTGCIWNLENEMLTNDYPIGVSNELQSDNALLSFREGSLIVIQSNG